jgi:hypothetical protein
MMQDHMFGTDLTIHGHCCLCDGYVLHESDWPYCPTCVALPIAERQAIFKAWAGRLARASQLTLPVFDVLIAGVVYPLRRDADYIHPPAVHEAFSTASETDLRFFLDTLDVDDWFTGNGTYRGRDSAGIGIVGQDG